MDKKVVTKVNVLLETGEIIYDKLSAEEQRDLAERVYTDNLGLVYEIIKCYDNNIKEDLLQESYFGILRALQKYDYTKGFKFSSYCYIWIKQRVLLFYKQNTLIRIPVNKSRGDDTTFVDTSYCIDEYDCWTENNFEDEFILSAEINEFLSTLKPAEKKLFYDIFIREKTLRGDLSREYGITGQAIYFKKKALVEKLDVFLYDRDLRG